MNNLNIQLHSVRNELADDFSATLRKISEMGYDGVEFCGDYGGYSGTELADFLDYLGLNAVSAHIPVEQIEDDENFRYHTEILSAIGCMYIVNPWVELHSAAEAEQYGKRLEKAAEKCAMSGFMFAHHNHGYEIEQKENGISYFDIMMSNTELTLTELDLFWLKHGGANIEDYLRKYAGRINLIHLKQMKDEQTKAISSLDDGIIDFAPLVKTAKKFGTEYFIYENDKDSADAFDDAKRSIDYFKKMH